MVSVWAPYCITTNSHSQAIFCSPFQVQDSDGHKNANGNGTGYGHGHKHWKRVRSPTTGTTLWQQG